MCVRVCVRAKVTEVVYNQEDIYESSMNLLIGIFIPKININVIHNKTI